MTYETDEDKELYEKKRYSFNGSVDVGSIVSFRMWGEESIRNGIRRKWREQRSVTDSGEKSLVRKTPCRNYYKDHGTIKVELDADSAPITVTNFVNLAKDGFYDGLTFHRIMEGFMMQGGDPVGNGTGGSDETIKGEFASNGVENPISHKRGTISMARAQDPDSGSSQFFIVHEDSTFLDGDYAAFGTVTEGMDIVDNICENAVVVDQNGTVKDGTQPVIEHVNVTD